MIGHGSAEHGIVVGECCALFDDMECPYCEFWSNAVAVETGEWWSFTGDVLSLSLPAVRDFIDKLETAKNIYLS